MIAVIIKFADVLITETRTVEDARVRARVKRPHITALNKRFMPKKTCYLSGIVGGCLHRGGNYCAKSVLEEFV